MELISSALDGIRFGLFPIGLVIVGALFTYRLCEETGSMAKIRDALCSVSNDPVVVTLLVAWGFGNFMEGIAGFGTAVAIPAAILAGIRMDGVRAIAVCLMANTVATTFGSVGVPTVTIAGIAGLEVGAVSAAVAPLVAAIMLLTPFLMVIFLVGLRDCVRHMPICLVSSFAFALPSFLIATAMGPELPVIIGGLAVMFAIVLFHSRRREAAAPQVPALDLLLAASPFLLVVVFLSAYALALPVAVKAKLTPGAVIFAAAVCGGLVQKVSLQRMVSIAWATLKKSRKALVTVCLTLAVVRVLEQLGAISALASAVVSVLGRGYVFAATAVGAFGGAITGSGTSSCVMFGGLQRDAALALGFDPTAFVAANLLGAGIGKMICPQSIAIGMAAVGVLGCQNRIWRLVTPWFVGILAVACLVAAAAAWLCGS